MADNTMGQRIAEERKKLGLSQEALGEKVGVSRQAISKWESDGAVPEVDKLIALSRLFGVSVGWLLGVEEQAEKQETSLSETQLKTVEEIIKKYHTPPAPLIKTWQQVLAVCIAASIFLCLFAMQITNAKQEAAIQNLADTSMYSEISARLSVLEAAVLNPTEQLLAEYDIDVSAIGRTSEDNISTAHVSFTAVPKVWVNGDKGYLCVSGGDGLERRQECTWDGTHLNASVNLKVALGYDKYELCFVVEHESGSQEQQLLQDDTIDSLYESFTIPIEVEMGDINIETGEIACEVEMGEITCEGDAIILTDFTVYYTLPPVFDNVDTPPAVTDCEYQLLRRPKEDSAYVFYTANMMTHRTIDINDDDFRYMVSVPEVRFEDVNIEDTDHYRLRFYIKLSNGMEHAFNITILIPDGNGGLE